MFRKTKVKKSLAYNTENSFTNNAAEKLSNHYKSEKNDSKNSIYKSHNGSLLKLKNT